jgi:hypothetical protein
MPLPLPVSSTVGTCAAMCLSDPACAAWAYLPSGCVPGSAAPACYLKASLQPPVAKPCRCSGVPTHNATAPPANAAAATLAGVGGATVSVGPFGMATMAVPLAAGAGLTAFSVVADTWTIVLGSDVVYSGALAAPAVLQAGSTSVTLQYAPVQLPSLGGAAVAINATYELLSWGQGSPLPFVRKSLLVQPLNATAGNEVQLVVSSVHPWGNLTLVTPSPLDSALYPSGVLGGYGAFARLAPTASFPAGVGVMAAVENSFVYATATSAASGSGGPPTVQLHAGYHPALQRAFGGPFSADALRLDGGLLALYQLSGLPVPPPGPTQGRTEGATSTSAATREATLRSVLAAATPAARGPLLDAVTVAGHMAFQLHGAPGARTARPLRDSLLDAAERDAMRGMADALYVGDSARAVRVHIPWTENDYQIDIANATLLPQYGRILQRLSDIGVRHNLYAGCDSAVSSRANNTDAWGWEETLWLNLGQALREGYWTPGVSPLPPTTSTLLGMAAAANVSLMPYVYPILGFTGSPQAASWLFPAGGGILHARLSSQAFQEYLIATLTAFMSATGARGAGFDYTFFEDGNSTTYASWFGWRRVMAALRQYGGTTDEFVVDNRQLNHAWGPWMWAATGSYAEPLQTDEGPYSWNAYLLDPHTDRQSANRERQMSYVYSQAML